ILALGVISLIVGIILIATRVLRPAPRIQNPVGSVLWESFIVMLALYAAPSFISLGGRRLSPETQPGLVALLLISADLLQIFSILHPQLPLGFLPIALIGASFAILAEWRQSLVPGMVAHAINNSIAFLGLTLLFPHRG